VGLQSVPLVVNGMKHEKPLWSVTAQFMSVGFITIYGGDCQNPTNAPQSPTSRLCGLAERPFGSLTVSA